MIEECSRRPRTKCNVEQDISCGRLSAAPSRARHDAANLLVAWPEEPELGCNRSHTPVGLSDRRGRVVEALRSCDEARVDSRSKPKHIEKGVPSDLTHGAQNETKETK
jgi:hypothetical protein